MDLETVILWMKSEREKQITHTVWNLKKLIYRWSYLQSRDKDTNIKNKCMTIKGEIQERWDKLGDWDWHRYTNDAMYKIYN